MWIFKTLVEVWSVSEWRQVVGSCEHGNKHLCSTKCMEHLDWKTTTFSRRTLLHGVTGVWE